MKLKERLEQVLELVKDRGEKICVLTHTNPDPDAIAAAFGLAYFFKETINAKAEIFYDGIIGRINHVLTKGKVKNVYFKDFVVQ